MATYRVHATKNYTVMSNTHLRDKNMSLKAKGLLSVMLSLPENWDYSINGLVAICKENNTAVESALKELKTLGYLIVTKRMPNETESGRIEYEYDIYETPQEAEIQFAGKQATENQGVENQGVEFQGVENNGQLNTNKSITNKSITKELNTKELNTENKKVSKRTSFDEIIAAYTSDEETIELLKEWLKVRKAKRAALTDKAIQLNIDKLDTLAANSGMTVNQYLTEVICKGWAAFYEIKQYGNNQPKAPAPIASTQDEELNAIFS